MTAITGTGWEAVAAMVTANATAQLIKFVRGWLARGEPDFPLLVSTGGMPSSHSSTVAALSTSIGMIAGWDSPLFAVTLCFSGITMYDAAGLRRSASLQAQALNEIVRELLAPDHRLNIHKLKELLGHTPLEVMAGAVLGIVVALGWHWLLRLS